MSHCDIDSQPPHYYVIDTYWHGVDGQHEDPQLLCSSMPIEALIEAVRYYSKERKSSSSILRVRQVMDVTKQFETIINAPTEESD